MINKRENSLILGTRQLRSDDILSNEQYSDIANLVFSTDKFIFPALFRSNDDVRKAAVTAISYSLKKGTDQMYRKENLFVCYDGANFKEAKIIGMILWYKGRLVWNFEEFIRTSAEVGVKLIYDNVAAINQTFFVNQSINSLVTDKIETEIRQNTLTLLNLCVDQRTRSCSVGTYMLKNFVSLNNNCPMELCVLKDNIHAVKLYRRCGFEITSEYSGFSETMEKPMCYGMKRSVQNRIE